MGAEPAAGSQIARITVCAERDAIPAVLAFLREVAGRLSLAPPSTERLGRAVENVCLNVIERGFAPGQDASFDVVFLRRPGQLVVSVEDRGLPFDFTSLEAASGVAAPSLTAAADAVRFLNLGSRGNRVEIVERLPYPDIETYITAGRAAGIASVSPDPSAAPVTLRLMTPEDAIAVARCTYAVYGYTLPDEYLYFPDRLREMLDGGLLEVCVGTTPDGEVVSVLTCEVERPARPSATWKRAWSIRASATMACSSRCCGSWSAARATAACSGSTARR